MLWLAAAAAGQEAPQGLPAPPPGPGTIRGQVVHATTGAPIPGAEVALYALSATGVPGVARATSDAEGGFAFEGISNDPATSYLVGARFAGVPHPGGRLSFSAGSTEARVDVRVSDVTTDPAAVSVGSVQFRLDRVGGNLRVTQTVGLRNAGTATYADPEQSGEPGARALLPDADLELQMPLGVMPEGLERDGAELSFFGPIHPGGGEIVWSYDLPLAEDGALVFAPPMTGSAASAEILLAATAPPAAVADVDSKEPADVEGRRYQRFVATGSRPSLSLVFPPARVDPDALAVEEVRVVLHADDAAMQVNETHVLHVDGDEGVRVAEDATLLRIPLPQRLSGLRFGTSDPGLVLEPDGRGAVLVTGTAPPGESMVELAYRVPVEDRSFEFARAFDPHVALVSIFLADTGRLLVESELLHKRRPARTSDLTYLHLEAFDVDPGELVSLRVGELPPRAALPPSGNWAVVLLSAVAAIWLLVEPLARSRSDGPASADDVPTETPERREREALYASIRDLDDDFETGKVAAEDHRVLRDELRSRALALLRAERTRASEPESPELALASQDDAGAGPAAQCPSCRAPVRAQDRFCSDCGERLASAEPERDAAP